VAAEDNSADRLLEHWDKRYATAGADGVSWFQERPATSLELITLAGVRRSDALIDIGGGASTLVDLLVADGWLDLTVLDVSEAALAIARDRLGRRSGVQWLCEDLRTWRPSRRYELWHDRAVFHFLVEEEDRRHYRTLLADGLADGGVVIVGAFALDGPTHCSGLPVARYDAAALLAALGGSFEVLAERREEHRTPAGDIQPFTWLALGGR
jgi:trans-aconitate methyltransferase